MVAHVAEVVEELVVVREGLAAHGGMVAHGGMAVHEGRMGADDREDMSADVAGSDATEASMEVVIEQEQSTLQISDNGNVNVGQSFSQSKNFGFDGKNKPSQGEANNVLDPNILKDAADEWPITNQIHSFYFVKYRLYEDPNSRTKFDQADKELQKEMQ
ncbi:hypothetical protein Dimus_031760 [Dionaea muscipula]